MRYFQTLTLMIKGRRGRSANRGPIYVQTEPPACAGLPGYAITHTVELIAGTKRRRLTFGRFGDRTFLDACPTSYEPTLALYLAGDKLLHVAEANLLRDPLLADLGGTAESLRDHIERAGLIVGDTLHLQAQVPRIVIRLPTRNTPIGKAFLSASPGWDLASHTLFSLDDWDAAKTYIEQVKSAGLPGASFEMEVAEVTTHPAPAETVASQVTARNGTGDGGLSPEQTALALAGMSGDQPKHDCSAIPSRVSDLLAGEGWCVGRDGVVASPEVGLRQYAVRFAHTVADNGAIIDCTGYLICRKSFYPNDILCLYQSLVGDGQVEQFVQECHALASQAA